MKKVNKHKKSKTLKNKSNNTKIEFFIRKIKSKDKKFIAYTSLLSILFILVISILAYTTFNTLNKKIAEQNTPSGSFELEGSSNPEIVAILKDGASMVSNDGENKQPGAGDNTNSQTDTNTTNKTNNSNNTNTTAPSSNNNTNTSNNETSNAPTSAPTPTQQTQTVTCWYKYGPMDGVPCPDLPPNNYYNTTKGCYAIGYGTYIQCPDYKSTVYSIEASRVCGDSSYCKAYCSYFHATDNLTSERKILMPGDALPNCSL
ncbi:hypothetical protein KBC85_00370 [Candidatus Saccharibacteria bacterium]|nr:hypothetical protein [Candidatus Saccharibacteria bacterium]